MNKRCTIVMPLYNKGKYLSMAIESVLSQRMKYGYDLIIADDCSTDDGVQIAEKYQAQYPDIITVLYAERNVGLLSNDIRVFENMKTDYFCVLDPDDYWIDPEYLQKAISFLDNNEDYVCYSANTVVDEEGKEKRAYISLDCQKYVTNSIEDYLCGRAIVPHTTAAIYRNRVFINGVPDIIRNAVGTKSEASYRGDHDRFVIHMKYGKAIFVNEYVGVYRIHSEGIWSGAKAIHRYLLDAQAKIDYSLYYEDKYKDKFKQMAFPYFKRAILEYEKMESRGEALSKIDKEIYENLKNEFDYHEIKLDMMRTELKERQNRLEGLMMLQQASNQELIWANVFHDTIRGSKWLPENTALSPGRWAVGYPGLYALYRVLDDFKPQSILELGLGQSTKLTGNYTKYRRQLGETCEHYVVEHDKTWIDFFSINNDITETQILNMEMQEITLELDENGSAKVNIYVGFGEKLKDKVFDLIFIDAPLGSDDYSRIDIVDILPNCLADNFVIMMDDYHRVGEKRTVEIIKNMLRENGIAYKVGMYSGEKSTALIVSENLGFLLTM